MEKPVGVVDAWEFSCQVKLARATRTPLGDAREVGTGDLFLGGSLWECAV